MATFDELVQSRKRWIDEVLEPWCREANRKDLRLAALDWADIAGQVDAEATLWTWAWSRFPDLTHDGLSGVNETRPVQVHLNNGHRITGFPDARQSTDGQLVLLSYPTGEKTLGPYSIDNITHISAELVDPA